MEFGIHLPQLELIAPPDSGRITAAVDAARELGFAAVSVNDHLTFPRPWADGPTLLAYVAERAGQMDLMTTVGLPTLRGPVPYAAAMSTLAALAGGRVIAGIGPGSASTDYAVMGVPWLERWSRFDDAARVLRELFSGRGTATDGRWDAAPVAPSSVAPAQRIELWLASWGSPAGLRRVARYGDGWLASAYHGTPATFGQALSSLRDELARTGRDGAAFGHALVTMWTWVTDDGQDALRMLDLLASAVGRPRQSLEGRVCIGTPRTCIELLTAYAEQGCRRVCLWPLADEPAQLARLAAEVIPSVPT